MAKRVRSFGGPGRGGKAKYVSRVKPLIAQAQETIEVIFSPEVDAKEIHDLTRDINFFLSHVGLLLSYSKTRLDPAAQINEALEERIDNNERYGEEIGYRREDLIAIARAVFLLTPDLAEVERWQVALAVTRKKVYGKSGNGNNGNV